MPRRRSRIPWKADLQWFLFFAALAQLALILFADWRDPALYDPEYGTRLGLLRRRTAEAPERPVLLVVGSSRIGLGFLPERLPPLRTPDGADALPFNFSHLAAGPVVNLVNLRRAVRDGVRPRWVVLELNPYCLRHESPAMGVTMSAARDLPVLQRFFNPTQVYGVYLRGRLNPWFSWRQRVLRQYAPAWATDAGGEDHIKLGPLGGDDGWLLQDHLDAPTRRRRTDACRAENYDGLQHYAIDPGPERALRESLALCRRRGIECVLLITPESDEFRGWYSPDGLARFDRFCDDLRRDYGVAVFDARTWEPDDEFTDGHHLQRPGAEAFTDRLGREVLAPLVEGRLGDGAASP
jgi:hypothetical protein